jgi:TonB family protein
MGFLGPSLRREKVRERRGTRVAVALAVSLVVNAVAVWLLVLSGAFGIPRSEIDPARVALAPISGVDWDANRAISGERAPAVQAPRPTPPKQEPKGTVVELPPQRSAEADEAPRDARFLAERNQKVEKETFSRFAGEYPRLAPAPQPGAEGPDAADGDGGERGKRAESGEGDRAGAEVEGVEGPVGERLALAPGPSAERGWGARGEGGRRAPGKLTPDLSLGPGARARILAGPNMDGYGMGLETGDATHLSAAHFKYATFFNQLRNDIGREWIPRVRDAARARDPDGTMIFYKDRTVVLGITLDLDGKVTDLSVIESSNLSFFDRVALASVEAAQPFPNPPRGLFGSEEVTRVPFLFTLTASERRPAIRWMFDGGR